MSEPVSEPHSSEDLVELRAELVELSRSAGLLAERGRELPEVASTTYSLVTPAASQAAGSSSSGVGAGYNQSVVHPKAKAPAAPIVQSWETREAIAADVGRWLRASLEGEHRGNSGRDRINLSSRLYIVIKDFSGVVTTHPVRIFSRFSEVRAICFQGHWGDSIFVGLPSQREVSVCLRAGGFSGPSQYP